MKKFITAVVVAAAMTTPVAFAQNQHFGHRHHSMAKFAEKLNLTDAQKQQIKDIRQADRQANQALYDQMKALHQQLRAAHKATQEKIYNSVLTADQRAQVDAWRAQRQSSKQ